MHRGQMPASIRRRRSVILQQSAVVQALERRMLLSLSAAGAEFRANTFTTGDQASPSVAADGDGDFVVAWQSSGQNNHIYAQRYNSAGAAQDLEFRVNSNLTFAQSVPSVAIDADGDFVVVWQSTNQDGYGA